MFPSVIGFPDAAVSAKALTPTTTAFLIHDLNPMTNLTPAHLALSKKLKDPKRLAKLLEALRENKPPWVVGVAEDEQLVRETLHYMGITI